jgi:hypothetical protein
LVEPPSSFDDVSRRFREIKEAERTRKEAEMKKLFPALRQDSVVKIVVDWDGHADDGSIEGVTFVKADGTRVEQDLGWSSEKKAKSPAVDAIEDFVFAMVPGGWETNEGGFGTCVVDVQTGEYDFRHVSGQGPPHPRHVDYGLDELLRSNRR